MSDERETIARDWPAPSKAPRATSSDMTEARKVFGDKLRGVREACDVSIMALAQGTRISSNFIEALESGHFEKLPGDVFGRGFVRNLARALSLPADVTESLLADYNSCCVTDDDQQTKKTHATSSRRHNAVAQSLDGSNEDAAAAAEKLSYSRLRPPVVPTKHWGLVAGIATIIVLGGLGYYFSQKNLKQTLYSVKSALKTGPQPAAVIEPIKAQKAEPVAASEDLDEEERGFEPPVPAPAKVQVLQPAVAIAPVLDSEPVKAEVPPAAPAPVRPLADAKATVLEASGARAGEMQTLQFIVTEPVRIRLGLDQEAATLREFKPDTYTFKFAKKAELLVFDAGAVKIVYNGKALGSLGSKGRVRRLSFEAALPTGEKL